MEIQTLASRWASKMDYIQRKQKWDLFFTEGMSKTLLTRKSSRPSSVPCQQTDQAQKCIIKTTNIELKGSFKEDHWLSGKWEIHAFQKPLHLCFATLISIFKLKKMSKQLSHSTKIIFSWCSYIDDGNRYRKLVILSIKSRSIFCGDIELFIQPEKFFYDNKLFYRFSNIFILIFIIR